VVTFDSYPPTKAKAPTTTSSYGGYDNTDTLTNDFIKNTNKRVAEFTKAIKSQVANAMLEFEKSLNEDIKIFKEEYKRLIENAKT
jgi:hypothetical protein